MENLSTSRKIPMEKHKGIYVMDVEVNEGGKWKKVEIVVDSGAADNVMPRDMLRNQKKMPRAEGVRFAGADGSDLRNYGRKLVEFVPKNSCF